jgi:hypothetical protein
MAIALKQSTASQEVPLGYFLDSTDGDSEETGLTINNTDIKLWKTGATTLANKNSGGATHISNGIYYAVLDATDTNTLGPMVIFVHVSGALTVRLECEVLPANVYDSLYSTDKLQVHAVEIDNDLITAAAIATGAIDADAIADNAIDAGAIAADAITAAKIATDAIDADAIADNAIDAASIAANAITAAKIATDAIDADALAADAIAEIQSGLSTLSAADLQTALGTNGSDQCAELAQAQPASTPSIASAIMLLYMAMRNQLTTTSSEKAVYNDAGTKVAKSTVSDNGTTFTSAKMVSGA